MYSLISMRMRLSSLSNRYSARERASWVFPTPVGPKKRKVPMGRWGSLRPARFLWMALTTVSTASSCPMMRLLSRVRIFTMRLPSLSATLFTGMPVILETTVAISSADTSAFFREVESRTMEPASSKASMALSRCSRS